MNENQKFELTALTLPDLVWQIGKTEASVAFVEAVEYRLTQGGLIASHIARLNEAIENIKSGELVLNEWLTVEQFLIGKYFK